MGFGESQCANSVAPILVSSEQGWGKSTFCRMLMPPVQGRYFTESYDLSAQSSAEQKLAAYIPAKLPSVIIFFQNVKKSQNYSPVFENF